MSKTTDLINQFRKDVHALERYKKLLKPKKGRGTRVYVLVNSGILPPVQRAVQAAHAVATMVDRYHGWKSVKEWARKYKTIILLSGNFDNGDGRAFAQIASLDYGLGVSLFYEPDIEEVTAIATTPVTKAIGKKMFENYDFPLMR
jgi:hypothetical protein